jgi:hypothetical protein
MIRLFNHYVPHVALLLGLVDALLLIASGELAWTIRAHQIGMDPEPFPGQLPQLLTFAVAVPLALVAIGPVFYRQRRVALCDQDFGIVKRTDAEIGGRAVWAAEDDPRITRIGRFIRKVRLDELPQCWTVLRGERSFVGAVPSGRSSSGNRRSGFPVTPSGTW